MNHLSKFSPNLIDMTKPMRELLKKENAWIWSDAQQQSIEKVKKTLTASLVIALFDPSLETTLSADASCHSLEEAYG